MAVSDSDLIDEMGGNKGLAALLGITESAISHWRDDGIPLPRREQIAWRLKAARRPVPDGLLPETAA